MLALTLTAGVFAQSDNAKANKANVGSSSSMMTGFAAGLAGGAVGSAFASRFGGGRDDSEE